MPKCSHTLDRSRGRRMTGSAETVPATCVTGWLAGWMAGWPAGWMAGYICCMSFIRFLHVFNTMLLYDSYTLFVWFYTILYVFMHVL